MKPYAVCGGEAFFKARLFERSSWGVAEPVRRRRSKRGRVGVDLGIISGSPCSPGDTIGDNLPRAFRTDERVLRFEHDQPKGP